MGPLLLRPVTDRDKVGAPIQIQAHIHNHFVTQDIQGTSGEAAQATISAHAGHWYTCNA